jgi:hypothetical protein
LLIVGSFLCGIEKNVPGGGDVILAGFGVQLRT